MRKIGLFLAALAFMAYCAAAASCTGTSGPWLSTEYVVFCDAMTANQTCFSVVSENSSGLHVEYVREWASPNKQIREPQPLASDSEGRLTYSFFLDSGRYVEGAAYDVATWCGNSSASLQFTQAGYMPPAWVASLGVWLSGSAPYCLAFMFLLFGALVIFVLVKRASGV